MSAAITVQQRHLIFPDSCLFSPSQLSIPQSFSKEDFTRLGKVLAQIDQADGLWKADYSLAAIERFEKEEGLSIASAATGLSKFFLYKASFVAKKFPPTKRFTNLKYSHYRELLPFPDEFLDRWLPHNADKNLSCKSLRALAVKEFGSEPYKAKQPKKTSVKIRCELYARLRLFSESQKVSALIERICEEWLKQRPEAQNQTVGSDPTVGNDIQSAQPHPETGAATETPRPTYAERREAPRAAGVFFSGKKAGQPIPQPKPRELQLQWSPCRKKGKGPTTRLTSGLRADCFATEAGARAAEEKYFREKGYHNEIVYCVVPCGAYHVRHSYSGEPSKKESASSCGALSA